MLIRIYLVAALLATTAFVPSTRAHADTVAIEAFGDTPFDGWKPSFLDVKTDGFSGAVTWNFDFGLPSVAGVRPDLSLNYNSRRMDGLNSFGQSDWAGYGWSIDTPEIFVADVRTAMRGDAKKPLCIAKKNR